MRSLDGVGQRMHHPLQLRAILTTMLFALTPACSGGDDGPDKQATTTAAPGPSGDVGTPGSSGPSHAEAAESAWPVADDQIVTIDFLGVLVAADTTGWTAAQKVDSNVGAVVSVGGKDSSILVGPGSLLLDDGTRVDVAAGTPGGNYCAQLDLQRQIVGTSFEPDACLVVGELLPGATTASWFATIPVTQQDATDDYYTGETFVQDGTALLRAGEGTYTAVPIASDAIVNMCSGATTVADAEQLGQPLGAVVSTVADTVNSLECLGPD